MRVLFAILLFLGLALAPERGAQAQATGAAVEELSRAMAAVRARDWSRRGSFRNATVRAVYDWHRLRAGEGEMRDYPAFVQAHGNWPGLPLLIQRGEQTIPRGANAGRVLEFFETQAPRTALGVLRYAAALDSRGRGDEADAEVVRAWTTMAMSTEVQQAFEQRHGRTIAPHMTDRLDMLLWRQRFGEAERLFDDVPEGWVALARARIALVRGSNGVNALIDRVPASLRSHPGLAYERFIWRAARGLDDGAVEMALSVKDNLGRPEEWGNRRRSLARALMRQGDPQKAYDLAVAHDDEVISDHFAGNYFRRSENKAFRIRMQYIGYIFT